MPFIRQIQNMYNKFVRHTFASAVSPADTGQQLSTIDGSATVASGAYDVTAAPALTAVTKGMGEPDVVVSAAYTGAFTSSGTKQGVAFWGTSATGGTWWSAYPTTSTTTTYYRYCNTPVTNCTGGATSFCLAASGIGSSSTATCTPSNNGACGVGCSITCTTYTYNNSSGPSGNYNISAGACGTVSVFIPTGSFGFARCCTCNTGASTCTGSLSTCSTAGCTPSGCGACPVTNEDSTDFNARIVIASGTFDNQNTVQTTTIATSSSTYPSIAGLIVSTSGNTITVRAYSNTALTNQRGTTVNYNASSPTKGDFVGLYSSTSVTPNIDTFTASA